MNLSGADAAVGLEHRRLVVVLAVLLGAWHGVAFRTAMAGVQADMYVE